MQLSQYKVGRALQELSSVVWLLIHTVSEISERILRGRMPFRMAIFFEQAERVGVGSVPLVSLVSLFLGITMALLTGYQLKPYGSAYLVPALVSISFTRELGPLITGIMIAARVGAAFTAELGTMVVAEEVEAIEAMGIGPLRFLVSPRLLAVFFLMPCLVVVANCAAIFGSALISNWQLDINFQYFVQLVQGSLYSRDIVTGVLKGFLFGLIIGLISCYKGLSVRGGAAGVGTATTSSVVVSITTVIGMDMIFDIVQVSFYGS